MESISIEDIIRWTNGTLTAGDPKKKVFAVSTDSRKDCQEALFIPLKGSNFDGHDFIPAAIRKGAAAYVTERRSGSGHDFAKAAEILVNDALEAYQKIAAAYRLLFNVKVIAVTGSNGKTTTKEYVTVIASSKFNTKATEGTKNNHVGVPESVLSLDSATQVAVYELGMSGFGEVRNLANIVRPSIGIITNICHVHTEFFNSLDDVALAKSELLETMPADGAAVLNADDSYFGFLKQRAKSEVISFGIDNCADITAKDIRQSSNEIRFSLISRSDNSICRLHAFGRHNVYNALAAAAAGIRLGITISLRTLVPRR